MAVITVRDIPETVVRELKNRASRNNRSMEQEVRLILAETVIDQQRAKERIESLRERFLRQPAAGEVRDWAPEERQWRGR
jgi:plasmid stability protein